MVLVAESKAETIANLTVQTLLRTVPPALPGIFFLSGESAKNEDNEEEATINLSTMNSLFPELPWHSPSPMAKLCRGLALSRG